MHNTLTQDVEVISPRSESTGVLPVLGGAHGQERAVGVRLRAVDEVQFVDTDAHKRLPCTVPLHSNLVPVLHVLAASSCRPGHPGPMHASAMGFARTSPLQQYLFYFLYQLSVSVAENDSVVRVYSKLGFSVGGWPKLEHGWQSSRCASGLR
jgi:hypothetical protein